MGRTAEIADLLVASVQVRAVIEKDCGLLDVTVSRELMQRRDAGPVRRARVHAALEQEFVQFTSFAPTAQPGKVTRLGSSGW